MVINIIIYCENIGIIALYYYKFVSKIYNNIKLLSYNIWNLY
jgi:hypothetical protein